MGLRSTYNTGEYNSGLFGAPETTQAASSATLAVSVSASAVTIVNAAASTAIAVTATASDGTVVREGSASVSIAYSVVAYAFVFPESEGAREGYGKSTYGTFIYGENYSVEDASANVFISVTASASAQVTRNVSSSAAIAFVASASSVYSVVGASSAAISISADIEYIRIRDFSALAALGFTPSVNARYKWIEAADPTNVWTEAVDPSTTWTEADFLERAA